MERLKRLDEVAYVRFASVYRQFKDLNAFMSELKDLLASPSGASLPASLRSSGQSRG
jgi:transcriptional regulator NrdR family protein